MKREIYSIKKRDTNKNIKKNDHHLAEGNLSTGKLGVTKTEKRSC